MSSDDNAGREPSPLREALDKEHLAEYGVDGDHSSARRGRRAFRFAVLACVFFTVALWFAEGYLRYSKSETQYRMALTLHSASARPILRNIVKRERASGEVSSAKYVEALADVEEDDQIFSCFEEAYTLNPESSFLILKYGVLLFLNGDFREARERFREAGIQPPKNALAGYLEAAALAASTGEEDDLGETAAVLARTNNSGQEVIFPAPLWHPSLPKDGVWYAKLRRGMVDRCCAPLYHLGALLVARAKRQIDLNQAQDWDSWLEELEVLGRRMVGNGESEAGNLGVSQAIAGVRFQMEALTQRKRIWELVQGAPSAGHIEATLKLENALRRLNAFEGARDGRIQEDRRLHQQPHLLIGKTLLVLAAFYLAMMLMNRMMHSGRISWAVPHSRLGLLSIAGFLVSFLILLMLLSALPMGQHPGADIAVAGTWSWYGLLALAAAFGLFYPSFALPSAHEVSSRADSLEEMQERLAAARKSRRIAYLSLLRRYYGILLGGFIVVVCAWVVGYRIVGGLYPWQFSLLTAGLWEEELAAVRAAQAMLAGLPGMGP